MYVEFEGKMIFAVLKQRLFEKRQTWICLTHVWTTHKEYLVVFDTVQNLAVWTKKLQPRTRHCFFNH